MVVLPTPKSTYPSLALVPSCPWLFDPVQTNEKLSRIAHLWLNPEATSIACLPDGTIPESDTWFAGMIELGEIGCQHATEPLSSMLQAQPL